MHYIVIIIIYIGHHYCKPRLKELRRYSEDVSKCWKDLALELDLPLKTADTIDIDYTPTKDKCCHMFDTWLQRSPDPCWCEIVEALKMMNMSRLATDIEAKHLGMLNLLNDKVVITNYFKPIIYNVQ